MKHDREYYSTRKSFTPAPGRTYRNDNGSDYTCIWADGDRARFRAVKGSFGKWTCTAHGVGIYADGAIDWNYSTDGNFT